VQTGRDRHNSRSLVSRAAASATSACSLLANRQLRCTDDGGATWRSGEASTDSQSGYHALLARSPDELWAVGNSTEIARSTDGGRTWAKVAPSFEFHPYFALTFSAGGHCWAGGVGGTIASNAP
jgi:photosystem II stability/assembly factor-like uncharacterized protein